MSFVGTASRVGATVGHLSPLDPLDEMLEEEDCDGVLMDNVNDLLSRLSIELLIDHHEV